MPAPQAPAEAGLPVDPSRRLFLKRSAFTALALGAGGLSAALGGCARYAPPEGPLRTFSPKEFAVLRAWVARLAPAGPGEPGAEALGIAARMDAEFAAWPKALQDDFKQLLNVFEDFALPLSGFWGRFTEWGPEKQDRYLADWMSSGLQIKRQGFSAVKTIAMFFVYARDEAWAGTGYPGPFDPRFRRPAYDALERTAP
jgi:hypothetical protein